MDNQELIAGIADDIPEREGSVIDSNAGLNFIRILKASLNEIGCILSDYYVSTGIDSLEISNLQVTYAGNVLDLEQKFREINDNQPIKGDKTSLSLLIIDKDLKERVDNDLGLELKSYIDSRDRIFYVISEMPIEEPEELEELGDTLDLDDSDEEMDFGDIDDIEEDEEIEPDLDGMESSGDDLVLADEELEGMGEEEEGSLQVPDDETIGQGEEEIIPDEEEDNYPQSTEASNYPTLDDIKKIQL